MNLRTSFFIAVTALCLRVPSVQAEHLTALADAALARSPGLKAAQAQREAARSGLSAARMHRLPRLSAQSNWTRGDQPVFVFGSLLQQGRFTASNFALNSLNDPSYLSNIHSSLDVGLPLFSAYEVSTAVRLQELQWAQSASAGEGRTQGLRFQVASLYLQMLRNRELLAMLDQRIKASQEEVGDARRLKERGVVLGSDFYAAEAILSALRSWKSQVETHQAAAGAELAILCGRESLSVEGSLGEPAYEAPARRDLTEAALVRHPGLQAAASHVSMTEAQGAQAGRSLLPRLQAFASLQTYTEDFSSNPTHRLYGVAAQVPFGDAGYGARRSQARFLQEAARGHRASLEEALRADIAQAYAHYEGALAARPTAKETVERAARSLDLFRPQYRSGRQSIMEVLRAEEGLAKAQANHIETLYQAHAAYLGLMSAAGTLDHKTLETIAAQTGGRP